MGQAFSDKQALRFDLSHGGSSDALEFHEWGTIKTCHTLPGPNNYDLKQCAVVINDVLVEKLRFFVYDERFDELIQIYQTTSNVRHLYQRIRRLLFTEQPDNLNKALKDLFGRTTKGVARSYKLDQVQRKYDDICNQALLCSGDLIARRMTAPLPSWHYGVYLDGNKVYHWVSPTKKKGKNKGQFMRTSLAQFMGNETQLFVEYDVVQIRSAQNKETRANNLLEAEYNLWDNNCEHLANEICRGDSRCDQKWMGIGKVIGNELTFTGMLFRALGGPAKKTKVKCIDCKAWNYDEKSCDVDKACNECRASWNAYQRELERKARERDARDRRNERERQRQYNNWDQYQRGMDSVSHYQNSLVDGTHPALKTRIGFHKSVHLGVRLAIIIYNEMLN